MSRKLEKYLGCIFGGVIGDIISAPYTGYYNRNLISGIKVDLDKPKQFKDYETGQYTDETQLTLAILKSILKNKKFTGKSLLKDISEFWKNNEIIEHPFETEEVINMFNSGTKWNKCALPVGKADCSTAFRVAPIGLWYNESIKDLAKTAIISSEITHKDYRATCGALTIAACIGYLVNNDPPLNIRHFITVVSNIVKPVDKDFAKNIKEILKCLGMSKEMAEIKLAKMGNEKYSPYEEGGGVPPFVTSVVFTSIYYFLKHQKNYILMINDIIKRGGAINPMCSIAGNLWGTLNGYNKLPPKLFDTLKDKKDIYSLTVKFFKREQ